MATNTYVALRTETVTVATPSVNFNLSGITGYTDLVLISTIKNTGGAGNLKIRFNGDTTSNYSYTNMYGNGSTPSSGRNSNQTEIIFGQADSGQFLLNILNIFNYANTTTFKTTLSRSNDASTANTYPATGAIVGLWRKTPEAITSFSIFSDSNIAIGSTFTIYGIAAASVGAKATGGIISSDSQYYYHTFLGNGTFTPTQSISADVLVVAGGGGGGASVGNTGDGGGGGAGGLLAFTSQALSATNYTCTVGGGGAQGTGAGGNGANGINSSFGGLTASVGGGGGGGAGATGSNGLAGGSGGGAGAQASARTGGAASPSGQGNAGGNSTGAGPAYGGGGGGGAGAPGGVPTTTVGGAGGIGLASIISGTSIIYAGGGGGGAYSLGTSGGAGGSSSGGNGGFADTVAAQNGTSNTGGGGGGAGTNSNSQNGGNGGSGIVIIRYAK